MALCGVVGRMVDLDLAAAYGTMVPVLILGVTATGVPP
jgi:hypothetical protein